MNISRLPELYSISLIVVLMFFSACEYENAEVNYDHRTISYEYEIMPIMNRKCTNSGCHDVNSTIRDFTNYNNIKSSVVEGKFQKMVFELKLMPPEGNIPLSADQFNALQLWVEQGAKN